MNSGKANNKRITLHLPVEDYEKCKEYARQTRMSAQAFIRNAVVMQLNMYESNEFLKLIDYRRSVG